MWPCQCGFPAVQFRCPVAGRWFVCPKCFLVFELGDLELESEPDAAVIRFRLVVMEIEE